MDFVRIDLSCLMSDAKSQRQVVHPNTPHQPQEEAILYTCFVALQDISINFEKDKCDEITCLNNAIIELLYLMFALSQLQPMVSGPARSL
jgi:hypothetical protein